MKILQALKAQPTQDGDGVNIQRIAGFDGRLLDPFLMIDELKSDNRQDFIGGFPAHPHRGIETFTYIIKGGFEHQDQMGNKKAIRSGDVQWMSTGRGVVHSEMPLAEAQGLHGFQIWINMDAKDKMNEPSYQDSTDGGLPEHANGQGATLKALAGHWHFASEVVQSPLTRLSSEAAIGDVSMQASAHFKMGALNSETALVYIHSGSLKVDGNTYEQGTLFVLDPRSPLHASSDEQSGFLILRGQPLRQPIAHWGPFVMNTKEQLHQAVEDYRNGRFGAIS
ncbi:pirin family protein [Pseudoalteromonas sp. SSDWG2]|uniref:pirin family protein n=1 Tax=Pseudoalteromonas sp. SSDWG2 TaxID=3139391 RepID=UPI003BABC310